MTKSKFNYIQILLIAVFCIISSLASAQNIRIGIGTDSFLTTARMQSFAGKWQFEFQKNFATGTYSITEEIHIGEDVTIMYIPKGIIARISSEKELNDGFNKVIIKGGDLLSLELPGKSPKILQKVLEITHDKEEIYIVNTLPINDYIVSCASNEAVSCEPEAIKAHLIAIESQINYLKLNTKHPKEDYDLCDESHCFYYDGTGMNRELVQLLFNSLKERKLYYKDKLIYPRYHKTCGGKISSAKDVYGVDNEPYHIAHSDLKDNKGSENCFHSPTFHWTIEVQLSSILDFLSLEFAGGAENLFTRWEPLKINNEGRIDMVRLLGRKVKEISGQEFLQHLRNFYGANSVKSLRCDFEPLRRTLLIRGMGEGDGVGMCLFGADGLAKKGMTYKEILQFYYPGTVIK